MVIQSLIYYIRLQCFYLISNGEPKLSPVYFFKVEREREVDCNSATIFSPREGHTRFVDCFYAKTF